ncbi:hypothetical protein Tco_1363216 [Tanacetum coccineum]
MKSSRLLLICFLVLVPVIISGKVISSGDQHQKAAKHTTWEVLFEDFAKRNVTHLDRNMVAISGCDDDLYQVWLSHDRSMVLGFNLANQVATSTQRIGPSNSIWLTHNKK